MKTVEKNISIAYLKLILRYDHTTGKLYWKERPEHHFSNLNVYRAWNSKYVDQEAGSTLKSGYVNITINGVSHYAHRIAWALFNGSFPSDDLDHKNRIRNDNRIKNLKDATAATNNLNQGIRKDNVSGVKGVRWDAKRHMWHATLVRNKVMLLSKFYDQKKDAVQARKRAEANYSNN